MPPIALAAPLLTVLGTTALAGGWTPLVLRSRTSSPRCGDEESAGKREEEEEEEEKGQGSRIASMCERAAGGVFFGLAVLHLLPESTELMGQTGGPESLNVGPAVAAAAFLLALAGNTLRTVRGEAREAEAREGEADGHYGTFAPEQGGEGQKNAAATVGGGAGGDGTGADRALVLRGVLAFVAAACTHGFLEGVVLGVQDGSRAFLTMFAAVALHRWAVAASLATRLAAVFARGSPAPYALVALFALAGPTGAVTGLLALHSMSDNVLGSVNAVAAGMFLFAAVHDQPRSWQGFALYAGGTTLVAVAHAVEM